MIGVKKRMLPTVARAKLDSEVITAPVDNGADKP